MPWLLDVLNSWGVSDRAASSFQWGTIVLFVNPWHQTGYNTVTAKIPELTDPWLEKMKNIFCGTLYLSKLPDTN